MAETITIEPRFNGPPDSGNGGYSCGRLARFVDAAAVEVTLRLPPAIGRPLEVERGGNGTARLLDGDAIVAEAQPVDIPLDAPPAVDPSDAAEAERDSPFLEADMHPFPTCFVCGPKRTPGDGLRIFAGPVAQHDVYGARWTPDPDFAEADGTLPPELVWAALDCPTSVPVANDPGAGEFRPIVLARLAVRIVKPVHAGEPHTIVSWPVELDGRKRHAGAALHDADGDLLAVARALWIELKPPSGATMAEAVAS
jgi:hypothetical protein